MWKLLLITLALSIVIIGALSSAVQAEALSFNRAQLRTENAAFVNMEADEVEADEDLRPYALGTLSSDDAIEEIQFDEDTVAIDYKQKGHLLALIPVTFTVRSIAHADGTVELKYPWYSAITIDNKTQVEIELRIAVDTTISAGKVGSVQAKEKSANSTFSASESALVASAMQRVLKSRIDGEDSVDN